MYLPFREEIRYRQQTKMKAAKWRRDARTINHAATASPATAKRGRLSERAWSDVLRAARIARAEGVALRVHGIEM